MKPRWKTKLTETKMKWLGSEYVLSVMKIPGHTKYKCLCYINDQMVKLIHDSDTLTEAKQAGMKWIRQQCFFEEESK